MQRALAVTHKHAAQSILLRSTIQTSIHTLSHYQHSDIPLRSYSTTIATRQQRTPIYTQHATPSQLAPPQRRNIPSVPALIGIAVLAALTWYASEVYKYWGFPLELMQYLHNAQ